MVATPCSGSSKVVILSLPFACIYEGGGGDDGSVSIQPYGGYRETGGTRGGNVHGCGVPALPNGTMILADWLTEVAD